METVGTISNKITYINGLVVTDHDMFTSRLKAWLDHRKDVAKRMLEMPFDSEGFNDGLLLIEDCNQNISKLLDLKL